MQKAWYEGKDAEKAIDISRSEHIPILIFVKDNQYASSELEAALDQEPIFDLKKFVGLRLEQGEEMTDLFNQLVPVQRLPCIYIFYDGNLIDKVYSNSMKGQGLAEKLSMILNKIYDKETPDQLDQSSGIAQNLTSEERKAILKAALEKKKALKQEEFVKSSKESETTRRNQAKELQKAKLDFQDREIQQIAEQKRKEKMEELQAKRRIKEQIAQDKAERAAAKLSRSQPDAEKQNAPSSSRSPLSQSTICKLNLRMEDGSTHRHQFEPTDKLEQVRELIALKYLDGNQAFDLLQSHPKYKFTAGDDGQTLSQLGLCPSNTLLIKTIPSAFTAYAVSASAGQLMNTVSLWIGWAISSISDLFGSFSSSFNTSVALRPSTSAASASSNARSTSSSSTRIRSVHNTKDEDDSSKKEQDTFYNGNSTSQQ